MCRLRIYPILLICVYLWFNPAVGQTVGTYRGKPVEDKYVIIKLKPQLKSLQFSQNQRTFDFFLQAIDATPLRQKHPDATFDSNCEKCTDLSLVYDFTYSADYPLEKVIEFLTSVPEIEYAVPNYIHDFLFVPNDSELSSQYYLNTCGVFNAWDITQGDTSVVIAIVDAGVAITHGDLVNQIKYNYADPINGRDDDNDGFIDNFRGWDFGAQDNNPDIGTSDHGTYVAGIASAEVNNNFATAGVGYSCKFLPIKISTPEGTLLRGYEGIVYAANNGAQIINCSWGSANSYTEYGQDVVNYVTYNKHSLVVAAAGNNNNKEIFYPASYSGVVSVAATQAGSVKWVKNETSGSNWNYFVDIAAPSAGFKSTAKNNSTATMSGGTSFAAPIISGIAGLLKSYYPHFSPQDIAERLRSTAEDIYMLQENEPYIDLLGSGEANAYNALIDSTTPALRTIQVETKNTNENKAFYAGDTLELSIQFKNYFAAAKNIYISISCESSILAPIESNVLVQKIDSGANFELQMPFKFKVVSTLPPNIKTYFKITYSGDQYYSYEYIPVTFNPLYVNFETGNFKATATANGTIGVCNSQNTGEYGIIYKNYPNFIRAGGVILATDGQNIATQIRNPKDFTIVQYPTYIANDSADVLLESKFYSESLQLFVTQYTYSLHDADALIHEYRITNNSLHTIDSLYVGVYTDWQVMSPFYNLIQHIDSLHTTQVSTIDPTGFYASLVSASAYKSGVYAIDNAENADKINTATSLSNSDLWYALTHTKTKAGSLANPNNPVATITHSVVPSIYPDATVIVRFAYIASEDAFGNIAKAQLIKNKYFPLDTANTTNTNVLELHDRKETAHIVNNEGRISYNPQNTAVKIYMYSSAGSKIYAATIPAHEQTGEYSFTIPYTLQTGTYIAIIDYGQYQTSVKTFVK